MVTQVYAVGENIHFKHGEGYLLRDDFGNLMDTWKALGVGSFGEYSGEIDDIYHLVKDGVTCRHSSGGRAFVDGRYIISIYGKPEPVAKVKRRILEANEKAKNQDNFLDDLRMEAQDIRDEQCRLPEDEG